MNKVILLNGSAGVGKTTISKMYLEEHPLALSIEGDQIIGMMGKWRESESKARELVFEHTKSLLKNHLKAGYDVVLPYLLTNHKHAEEFQKIAENNKAKFYEIILYTNREEAVSRLLERGLWGEEGSETLTKEHREEIEGLYDKMIEETANRIDTSKIEIIKGDIKDTYSKLINIISEPK